MIVSQESTEVRWTPRHEISGLQIHPTTESSPAALLREPLDAVRRLTPRLSATSGIAPPWRTNWTASRRNDSGYGGFDFGIQVHPFQRRLRRTSSGLRNHGESICDAPRHVVRPLRQKIVGRNKHGRQQQVEVGEHRGPQGRRRDINTGTSDFDLLPYESFEPTTATAAVESLI
jgi:hypothetical protein